MKPEQGVTLKVLYKVWNDVQVCCYKYKLSENQK